MGVCVGVYVYVYVCVLCVGVCLGLWAVSLSQCMQWCSRQAVEKEDEFKEKNLSSDHYTGRKRWKRERIPLFTYFLQEYLSS